MFSDVGQVGFRGRKKQELAMQVVGGSSRKGRRRQKKKAVQINTNCCI